MTLFVIFWLSCAVLHAGLCLGYLQKRFTLIAEGYYTEDLSLAWFLGLLAGPLALMISFFQMEFFRYGWSNPFRLSYKKP